MAGRLTTLALMIAAALMLLAGCPAQDGGGGKVVSTDGAGTAPADAPADANADDGALAAPGMDDDAKAGGGDDKAQATGEGTLPERLAEVAKWQKENMEPDLLAGLHAEMDKVRAAGLADNAVAVGGDAPMFTLTAPDGTEVSLEALLADGPVVLFTFRGGWCPFCNLALDIVQENLAAFRAKGASVVGITPQKSALLDEVAAKKGLEYTVLSDVGYQVLDAYGIGYEVSPEFAELFKQAGKDVAAENVEGEALKLPLPSFFVIGQDGKVVYANVAYACAERPALEEVLAAIPAG